MYHRWYVPAPLPPELAADRRHFGDRLRALRTAAGLTQEQLAERAALDRKTVIRIEGGIHSPALDKVFVLARALDQPALELFRW